MFVCKSEILSCNSLYCKCKTIRCRVCFGDFCLMDSIKCHGCNENICYNDTYGGPDFICTYKCIECNKIFCDLCMAGINHRACEICQNCKNICDKNCDKNCDSL